MVNKCLKYWSHFCLVFEPLGNYICWFIVLIMKVKASCEFFKDSWGPQNGLVDNPQRCF